MTPRRCVIHDCKNFSAGRGLCANCYYKAKRLIKRNITSWAKLEAKGMALPSNRTLQGKNDPFYTQFNTLS